MNCEECDFEPPNPIPVPDGSFPICYPCYSEHSHVGRHRDGSDRKPLTINGDPHSPDGFIRYAADMSRRAYDDRPIAFVESFSDWSKREGIPEITIRISDPLGILGPDHPKEIVTGGTSEEVN